MRAQNQKMLSIMELAVQCNILIEELQIYVIHM